jgi:hypothetical protein
MIKSFAAACGLCLALALSVDAQAADDLAAKKYEPLTIGQSLPEFEGVAETGQLLNLADFAGQRVLVLKIVEPLTVCSRSAGRTDHVSK